MSELCKESVHGARLMWNVALLPFVLHEALHAFFVKGLFGFIIDDDAVEVKRDAQFVVSLRIILERG